jgi:DNA-binding PadR family transcriptional regulator
VLALLAERPSHGWALAAAVEPGTDIGEIWAGGRQRVYRALQTLQEHELIEAFAIEPAGGPHRIIYRVTPAGQKQLQRWLAQPVEHVREAHASLLLKVAFLSRSGSNPVPLLNAQRAKFALAATALRHQLAGLPPGEGLHLRLRLQLTDAVLAFIDDVCNAFAGLDAKPRRTRKRASA